MVNQTLRNYHAEESPEVIERIMSFMGDKTRQEKFGIAPIPPGRITTPSIFDPYSAKNPDCSFSLTYQPPKYHSPIEVCVRASERDHREAKSLIEEAFGIKLEEKDGRN